MCVCVEDESKQSTSTCLAKNVALSKLWMHINHVDFLHSVQSHVFVCCFIFIFFVLFVFFYFASIDSPIHMQKVLSLCSDVRGFINNCVSTAAAAKKKRCTRVNKMQTTLKKAGGCGKRRRIEMRVGCAKMSLWQLIVCFFFFVRSSVHVNYIAKLTKMWYDSWTWLEIFQERERESELTTQHFQRGREKWDT